jgi:hypothetical protein
VIPVRNQADTAVSVVAPGFDLLKYSLITAFLLFRSGPDFFGKSTGTQFGISFFPFPMVTG